MTGVGNNMIKCSCNHLSTFGVLVVSSLLYLEVMSDHIKYYCRDHCKLKIKAI